MTIPNSTISYAQREESPDFLFFNMREPHAFGEDYVDSIIEVLKTFGVKRYCLIGGMYDIVPHTRPLLVSGRHRRPTGIGRKRGGSMCRKATIRVPPA